MNIFERRKKTETDDLHFTITTTPQHLPQSLLPLVGKSAESFSFGWFNLYIEYWTKNPRRYSSSAKRKHVSEWTNHIICPKPTRCNIHLGHGSQFGQKWLKWRLLHKEFKQRTAAFQFLVWSNFQFWLNWIKSVFSYIFSFHTTTTTTNPPKSIQHHFSCRLKFLFVVLLKGTPQSSQFGW